MLTVLGHVAAFLAAVDFLGHPYFGADDDPEAVGVRIIRFVSRHHGFARNYLVGLFRVTSSAVGQRVTRSGDAKAKLAL